MLLVLLVFKDLLLLPLRVRLVLLVIRDIKVHKELLLTYRVLEVLKELKELREHLRLKQVLKVLLVLLVFKDLQLPRAPCTLVVVP